MWRKGNPIHCWWEDTLVQALWETVKVSKKNKKMELLYDPATTHLGIYTKNKNTNLKRYMHPNVQSSIIYNCQNMEAT